MLFHPIPAFLCNCSNAVHYACSGICGSWEGYACNKGLIKAFGECYSTLCCSLSDLCAFFTPSLRFHAIVATNSIMLAMRFVDQGKVACLIKVLL